VLGLDLRVEGSLLRFDDPASGPLLMRREVLTRWHAAQRALGSAEQRAQAAEQRAQVAERRAQAAEDALAAVREELRRPESE
jgi:hypothetical protein